MLPQPSASCAESGGASGGSGVSQAGVAPRADAQLALQNLHRVELERQSRLQARLRGVRRGLEVARVQQGGAAGGRRS